MIDIHRILCPIDFSDDSRHALAHAIAVARWYDAPITLLHVSHPEAFSNPPLLFAELPRGPAMVESALQAAEEEMATWSHTVAAAGVEVETSIARSDDDEEEQEERDSDAQPDEVVLGGPLAELRGSADGFSSIVRREQLLGNVDVRNSSGTDIELGRVFARPRDLPRSCDMAMPITSGCVRDCSSISSNWSITMSANSCALTWRPMIAALSFSSCG